MPDYLEIDQKELKLLTDEQLKTYILVLQAEQERRKA